MPDPMSEQVPGQQTDIAKLMLALQQMRQQAVQNATGPSGSQPAFAPSVIPPGPTSNIQFNPTGAPSAPIQTAPPPQRPGFTPTGSQSIGDFATKRGAVNAGLISLGNSIGSMLSNAEQKQHSKKVAEAENYMLQINSLLATGVPKDRDLAQTFMDDPKIRKVLKEGLEYVPLEQEVPPEAQGVQKAISKIQTQGGGRGPMMGPQQQQSQRQAVLPQPSVQQQIQGAMQQALLQKLKQDPAKALSLMGADQLSSAEEHLSQVYEKGLDISPAVVQAMSMKEKIAGMQIAEKIAIDTYKMQVDLAKAQIGYSKGVRMSEIQAGAKRYWADQMKAAVTYKTDKSGVKKYDANATAMKYYQTMAGKYLDIVKNGKTGDGVPLTDEQKAYYEKQAHQFESMANDQLIQSQGENLVNFFATGEVPQEPDTTDTDEKPE